MNAIPAFASQSTFVPLALEEEDVATYVAMASVLGCTPEECGEGFMMATPLARDAAVLLWRSAASRVDDDRSDRGAARCRCWGRQNQMRASVCEIQLHP